MLENKTEDTIKNGQSLDEAPVVGVIFFLNI
jgi:hypothetical protein